MIDQIQTRKGPTLFMGPMEGITDVPFRRIIRKHGCHVTCTQMIHAEALLRARESRRVKESCTILDDEKPVGLQLCGPQPESIGEAARKAVDLGAAFIDINMGCPAKNVVKNGAGAALLRDPQKAATVVSTVKKSVNVPVSVKIRAGWDDTYRNATDVAKRLEEAGATLVSVHARTRAQKFKGKADWALISELKKALSIPVIGNGDVFSPSDITQMHKETSVDGIMIARGALGNPWLFSQRFPTVQEIKKTMLEHLDGHLSYYGNKTHALMTFRKHLVWYTRGLANAAEFRVKLFKEDSLDVLLSMIHGFFDRFDPASRRENSDAR